MSQSDYQWKFLQCQSLLIGFARMKGWKLTPGRGLVSPEANKAEGGHEESTHLYGLGQDYNLFINGDWIRWGGDWGDFNHFSFEWQGVK